MDSADGQHLAIIANTGTTCGGKTAVNTGIPADMQVRCGRHRAQSEIARRREGESNASWAKQQDIRLLVFRIRA